MASFNPLFARSLGRVGSADAIITRSAMTSVDVFCDGSLRTLEELLARCAASGGVTSVVRVVVQDEYTHDVIVRDRSLGRTRWLVYDST
jgi:hypothetical protein